jgi:hypothetical protein
MFGDNPIRTDRDELANNNCTMFDESQVVVRANGRTQKTG